MSQPSISLLRIVREVLEPVTRSLERLKWFLWPGNVYQALIRSVAMDLEVAVATRNAGTARKLLRAVEEFHTYIDNNLLASGRVVCILVCGVIAPRNSTVS
jgi:hypothetical protein